MRISFVTHGGVGRGMGHITRCLALAGALTNRGHACVFRLPDAGGQSLVLSAGIPCEVLDADEWGRPDLKTADLTVIDHYAVTVDYFHTFSSQGLVLYIDDLCLEKYPIAGLLNGHFYAEDLHYRALYKNELLLLGPQYSLLRSGYTYQRGKSFYPISELLITTGGTDPNGLMEPMLEEALRTTEGTGIKIHGILGSGFENPEKLINQFRWEPRVILHERPVTLSAIMGRCQLAVSSSGTTLYELAAFGIPSLTWQMVDNQRYVYSGIIGRGLAKAINPLIPGDLSHILSETLRDEAWINDTAKRLMTLVDGHGAERAADALVRYLSHQEVNA